MTTSLPAPLEVAVEWQSPYASHRDRTLLRTTGLPAEYFSADQVEQLHALNKGASVHFETRLTEYRQSLVMTIRRDQFRRRSKHPVPPVVPRTGRFYPRRFVSAVTAIDQQVPLPLRCLDAGDEQLVIDLNHPLAGRQLKLTLTLMPDIQAVGESNKTTSDICHDVTLSGPGMQAALPNVDTDFFSDDAFRRMDESPDAGFYARPRLVQHLDATCRRHLGELYSRFLQPGMQVLDLMSSWVSHLPEELANIEVHGLGLNAEELRANPKLSGYTCQDLNQQTTLPFADARFDAIICTASVEYLVRPVAIMQELARVLKPGAPLVMTFSDRWFPPKAIHLWSELHPYERMGLVIDYFRFANVFSGIESESLRGYPRPADDPHSDKLDYSDPMFAVWGYRNSQ